MEPPPLLEKQGIAETPSTLISLERRHTSHLTHVKIDVRQMRRVSLLLEEEVSVYLTFTLHTTLANRL
jgi:hypothetical protein